MTRRSEDASWSNFTACEFETADILLHLPKLFFESESRRRFPSWAVKGRRSRGCPLRSFVCVGLGCSSSSEYLLRGTGVGSVGPKCEKEGPPAVKAEASSPATPLSFAPSSESDEKPKRSLKRKLPLKKREEWLEIIDGLTKRRESLKLEIENMRRNCDDVKACNLDMEAKLRLRQCLENENGKRLKTVFSLSGEDQDADQKVQMHSSLPSTAGCVRPVNNGIGPSSFFDLNVPAEEMVGIDSHGPFDLNVPNQNLLKVMAAQARQRRMQIYRAKKLQQC